MKMKNRLAFGLILLSAPLAAEEPWSDDPLVSPFYLATEGWHLATSSGLSWPDGRQAIVTYWSRPDDVALANAPVMFRCITYFDDDMAETGGLCRTLSDFQRTSE